MKKTIIIGIIILGGLVFFGYKSYKAQQYEQHMVGQYEQHIVNSLHAWENKDCQTVREEYFAADQIRRELDLDLDDRDYLPDPSISLYRIYDYCRAFVHIVPPPKKEPSRVSVVLIEYYDLLEDIENDPQDPENILVTMKDLTQPQVALMFENVNPAELADEKICLRIFDLHNYGLIADPDINLPLFYAACADIFFEAERYGETVVMYQRLLEDYPDHELADEHAVERLAKALSAEVDYQHEAPFTGLQIISTGGSGNPVVTIQNDGGWSLGVSLDGLDKQYHVLDDCSGCAGYRATTDEPGCIGPEETFEIKPGIYEVVASYMAVPDKYKRQWALKTGTEYYICFYVTRQKKFDFLGLD